MQVCKELKSLRAERVHKAEWSKSPHTSSSQDGGNRDRLAELQQQLEEVCLCVCGVSLNNAPISLPPQTHRERDELQEMVQAQRDTIQSLQLEAETASQALSTAGADASRLRSKVAQFQGMLDAGMVLCAGF